jgi:hypothetical protein
MDNKNTRIEESKNNFIVNLYRFLYDLNRYVPTKELKELLGVYENLPMDKMCLRYYTIMKHHMSDIKSKNERMFKTPIEVLPNGIDLSLLWPKLSSRQKKKIWVYLEMLYTYCEIILVLPETSTQDSSIKQVSRNLSSIDNKIELDNKSNEHEFNPYVGVGGSDEQYGIREMFSGPKILPTEGGGLGLGSMTGLLGLNNMFDIKELRNQLKNMSSDDIDKATSNLKDLLGSGVSEKTSNLISDMLSNITTELKNTDDDNENPIDSIMKIADKVANNLRPKIKNEGVSMEELLQSTSGLTKNLKDKNGNSLFGGGNNPFGMLDQMMSKFAQRGKDPNNMTQHECIQECNNMLRSMGMNLPRNFSIPNIPNMPPNEQLDPHGQTPRIPQKILNKLPQNSQLNRKMRRKFNKLQKKTKKKKK